MLYSPAKLKLLEILEILTLVQLARFEAEMDFPAK